jgi:hypothetical protein
VYKKEKKTLTSKNGEKTNPWFLFCVCVWCVNVCVSGVCVSDVCEFVCGVSAYVIASVFVCAQVVCLSEWCVCE